MWHGGTHPAVYLWKFSTDITAVLVQTPPDVDALLGEDRIDACSLDAWHFDFEGPWLGESAPLGPRLAASAPLQRLTIFFGDPPNMVEEGGALVPAPRNEAVSSLLEAICTDEMCETNPAWAQRRKGLSGVCFAAFTDRDDEGVWCEDMPGPPVLARTVRILAHGVHRAERVRVETLRGAPTGVVEPI